MRILFVCLGNICRSPLAEAIFNAKASDKNLSHLYPTDSCGTSNYNIGDNPDPRTIRSAARKKIPISHRARQLTQADLENFDLILAMDKNNLREILNLCTPAQRSKVNLMRRYDPQGNGDVPDPYYGDEMDFENVYEILERSIDSLLMELSK
jgi:protein-tyrosine phosphatase